LKSETGISILHNLRLPNWLDKFNLAPYQLLGFSAALLLFVDLGAIYTLSEAPHSEIEFRAKNNEIFATKEIENSAAHRELSGKTLILIGGEETLILAPMDLMEEPDFLVTSKDLGSFFDRQQTITDILKKNHYIVQDASGNTLAGGNVETKLTSFPIMFWLQLIVGNIGFLVGMALFAFQRHNIAAVHYCWTGTGLALAAISAAIYSSRPISLSGNLFEFLSSANQIGTLLFAAAFLSMVWHYPKALSRINISAWCYVVAGLIFLSEYFGIIETLDFTRRFPAITVLALASIILVKQWYRSKGDPLERQTLKWFVFITLSGSTFFVVMIMVPPILGLPTSISQGGAFSA